MVINRTFFKVNLHHKTSFDCKPVKKRNSNHDIVNLRNKSTCNNCFNCAAIYLDITNEPQIKKDKYAYVMCAASPTNTIKKERKSAAIRVVLPPVRYCRVKMKVNYYLCWILIIYVIAIMEKCVNGSPLDSPISMTVEENGDNDEMDSIDGGNVVLNTLYSEKIGNLEKSIAAVFNKVAYGSTTTKRSIPDNVFVPSLTTIPTPPLTTFR